jgi:hypothetical protein
MDEQYNTAKLNVQTFHLRGENTALQWAFKFNTALVAAKAWHLKSHTLKIKNEPTSPVQSCSW